MGDAGVERWLAARTPERGAYGRLKPGAVVGEWRIAVFLGAGLSAEVSDEKCGDGVDAWVSPDDLTIELAEWITRLEPFGEGNPEPVFGMKNAVLRDIRPLGAEGRHLALAVNGMRSVWWGRGDIVEELRGSSSTLRDVLFTVEESDYGSHHVELRIVEIR